MNSGRRLALAALLALAGALPLSPPSPLPSPVAPAHALTAARSPLPRVALPGRKWGVAGAILCGIGLKVVMTTGPNASVIAVALSSCLLAALDVVTTEE